MRHLDGMLIYGNLIKAGVNLGTGGSFSDFAATVADLFAVRRPADGTSFFSSVIENRLKE